MKSPPRKATGVALIVMVFVFLISCLNKKPKSGTELRSVTVRNRSPEGLDLPLLKSFGFNAQVKFRELSVPLPDGNDQSAVTLGCLEILMNGRFQPDAQKLLPLYAAVAQSQSRFLGTNPNAELLDLLSPAVQAGLNNEFRFENVSAQLSSSDALFAALMSDARAIQFTAFSQSELQSLLTTGVAFRAVGEFLDSVKPARASRRDRNSGLAVGDLLLVLENGLLKHTALWLDHDVYFEAVPFGRSVLFRLASYEQLLEELSLRSNLDVRSMKLIAVRRAVSWGEVVNRMKVMKEPTILGRAELALDSKGRGLVSATSGLRVISRLRK